MLQLSAYLKATDPSVMTGDSVSIADRLKVGTLYCSLGIVPVSISTYTELNARADIVQSSLSVQFFTGFKVT